MSENTQKRGQGPRFFDILIIEIKFKIKKPTAARKKTHGKHITYNLNTYKYILYRLKIKEQSLFFLAVRG